MSTNFKIVSRLPRELTLVPLAMSMVMFAYPICASQAADSDADLSPPTPDSEASTQHTAAAAQRSDKRQTDDANQSLRAQAAVINSVPGVHLKAEDLKEAPAHNTKRSLNPIHWIFGPLITLEEQTARLQQQMVKLTGPLAALRPIMLELHDQVEITQKRMQAVNVRLDAVHAQLEDVSSKMSVIDKNIDNTNQHMKSIEDPLHSVEARMSSVESSIVGTYKTLGGMRTDISEVRKDIGMIKNPIMRIQQPLESIAEPVKNLDQQLTGVHTELVDVHTELGGVHSELGAVRKPLTNIERPISDLEREVRGLHKEIADLRYLLGLVLTAIFLSAVLTAIGTPIAAILIWRNRRNILPPPRPDQSSEEQLINPTKLH
jgi:uncharacterized coiled-coil DUF342 family protein